MKFRPLRAETNFRIGTIQRYYFFHKLFENVFNITLLKNRISSKTPSSTTK